MDSDKNLKENKQEVAKKDENLTPEEIKVSSNR